MTLQADPLQAHKTLQAIGLKVHDSIDTRGRVIPVTFEAPSQLNNAKAYYFEPVEIGAYSFVRSGIVRYVRSIGRYTSIGPNVVLGDGEHPTDWLSSSPALYSDRQFRFFPPDVEAAPRRIVRRTADTFSGPQGSVEIGNDVWIGANVVVRRGVRIGDGAIVGANAVVIADVPDYAVVAGVPARLLRYRFDARTIADLQALRWWEFDANDLAGVEFPNVRHAIDEISRRAAAGLLQRRPRLVRTVEVLTKGYRNLSEPFEKTSTAIDAPEGGDED